jgi:hypothetical protein
MTKRVQVTLSADEFNALQELAHLRGDSMSRVLGGEIEAYGMYGLWCEEIKVRKASEVRLAALEIAQDKRLAKLKARPTKTP